MKTKEIEIVDFSNTLFNDIPHQDNPACLHLVMDNPPKTRCLMLVKANDRHQIGNPGVAVLDIYNPENKYDGVLSLGVFYEKKNAIVFANSYINELNKQESFSE